MEEKVGFLGCICWASFKLFDEGVVYVFVNIKVMVFIDYGMLIIVYLELKVMSGGEVILCLFYVESLNDLIFNKGY